MNYEAVTNKTYITNYKEEPLVVKVPIKPIYYPDVLTADDKTKYISIVKESGISQVESAINVVESQTTEFALYTETVLKMETQEGKVYNVKFILNNGEETPQVVDVTPAVETVEEVKAEVEIT